MGLDLDQAITAIRNNSETAISLSYNQIGDEGARRLSEALQKNNTLTTLHLGGNKIGDEGARRLSEALQKNNTLTTLDLEGNKIGDEGATSLSEALQKNNTLTTLDLHVNKIGHEGATSLSEALQKNNTLTTLSLWDNQIGDEGARRLSEALQKNNTLTTLDLNGNKIGVEGARRLSEALQKNNTLTTLHLGWNKIGDEGATRLSEALQKNNTLTTLSLWDNQIGDEGATRLSEALQKNNTLTTLDLDRNKIGVEGATRLSEALQKNNTLTTLHLDRNKIRDYQIISQIEQQVEKNKQRESTKGIQVPSVSSFGQREEPNTTPSTPAKERPSSATGGAGFPFGGGTSKTPCTPLGGSSVFSFTPSSGGTESPSREPSSFVIPTATGGGTSGAAAFNSSRIVSSSPPSSFNGGLFSFGSGTSKAPPPTQASKKSRTSRGKILSGRSSTTSSSSSSSNLNEGEEKQEEINKLQKDLQAEKNKRLALEAALQEVESNLEKEQNKFQEEKNKRIALEAALQEVESNLEQERKERISLEVQLKKEKSKTNLQSQGKGINKYSSSVPLISAKQIKDKIEIGRGGFAIVFKGNWSGHLVAFKKLIIQGTGEAFERELSMISGLRHPNIVQVLARCEDVEKRGLVMEFCSGGSLADLLHSIPKKKKKMPLHMIVSVIRGIACGLSYLHNLQPVIIHGDLKSNNIMFDAEGKVKLIDFGVSIIKRETRKMTKQGFSIQWAAPELFSQQPVNEQIDIFSLGRVIFEMLTNAEPFAGMNDMQIFQEVIVHKRGPRLPQGKEMDQRIVQLMEQCTQIKPSDRPRSEVIMVRMDALIKQGNIKKDLLTSPTEIPNKLLNDQRRWEPLGDPIQDRQASILRLSREEDVDTFDLLDDLVQGPLKGDGWRIKSAILVKNPILENLFKENTAKVEDRLTNDAEIFNKQEWRKEADAGTRIKYLDEFDKLSKAHQTVPGQQIKIIPLVHGLGSMETALKISRSGFASLCKLDGGYFGKGIYLTSHIDYAALYASDFKSTFEKGREVNLILGWAACGNPYPCSEMRLGKPLEAGHDSHYSLVYPLTKRANESEYLPWDETVQWKYDEVVIEQQAQVLPRYILTLERK